MLCCACAAQDERVKIAWYDNKSGHNLGRALLLHMGTSLQEGLLPLLLHPADANAAQPPIKHAISSLNDSIWSRHVGVNPLFSLQWNEGSSCNKQEIAASRAPLNFGEEARTSFEPANQTKVFNPKPCFRSFFWFVKNSFPPCIEEVFFSLLLR